MSPYVDHIGDVKSDVIQVEITGIPRISEETNRCCLYSENISSTFAAATVGLLVYRRSICGQIVEKL